MPGQVTPDDAQGIDNKPADVLGPDGEQGAIVNPLPDPVNPELENDAQKLMPENNELDIDNAILAQSNVYVGFDAQIHAVNPDGTPKRKANGDYALKRGRKAGNAPKPLDTLPNANQATKNQDEVKTEAPKDEAPKIDYTGLGKTYAAMFFGASASIIGPEWLPASPEEKKQVEQAFTMYAKSTGAVDLPPGWALVFTLGFYSAARFQHQNTQSKFTALKNKLAHVWLWAKQRVQK